MASFGVINNRFVTVGDSFPIKGPHKAVMAAVDGYPYAILKDFGHGTRYEFVGSYVVCIADGYFRAYRMPPEFPCGCPSVDPVCIFNVTDILEDKTRLAYVFVNDWVVDRAIAMMYVHVVLGLTQENNPRHLIIQIDCSGRRSAKTLKFELPFDENFNGLFNRSMDDDHPVCVSMQVFGFPNPVTRVVFVFESHRYSPTVFLLLSSFDKLRCHEYSD